MDGNLWRYQKVSIGLKKWVKNSAKLSWASSQANYGILTLVDKDKKVQIKLNSKCEIQSMPAQYKNRDHTFEVVCIEDKVHLLAADSEEMLFQWLSKIHDVAGLRKDHLFAGGADGGGGGMAGSGGSAPKPGPHVGGGGGKPTESPPVLEVQTELQDNLLYDSCENKSFPVTIKPNLFSESLSLHQGNYTLQLDSMKLTLIEPVTGKSLFSWPYRYLRRYGREKNLFSMEVGRRCVSGEGLIRFNVQDGNQVFDAIQTYVSAMSGRNFSSSSQPTTPPTAPQAAPSFPVVPTEHKTPKVNPGRTPGVKVLPTSRDRTHSTGSRNIAPKPSSRPQFSNRSAQSVDDISSKSDPLDQCYSSVSDEAVDRSKKLPSPTIRRAAPPLDSGPEQHYDVASEPAPKQWPQIHRREMSDDKSNGVKSTKPYSSYTSREKSSIGDTLNSDMSAIALDDSGDPGLYSSLDQPPGSPIGADASQVYSEADDHGHIYDHLARQKLGNSSNAPRLPPPNNKPVVAPKGVPAIAAKPTAQDEDDMLYDHLDRGQTGSTQPGGSPVGTVPEDAYDSLSLDAPVGSSSESGYLVSSYPPSTVPEESEYAEANDQNYYEPENMYEVAQG